MQRYFVQDKYWTEDQVILLDDAHHIIRVMRLDIEDEIICIHPDGKVAQCKIITIDPDEQQVVASIKKWLDDDVELPVQVTVLQSLPKGNKLDFIIQKGTELGAAQFLLFESERSVVKWNKKRVRNRLERYRKIAKEASEQSGRTQIPEINYIDCIKDFLRQEKDRFDVRLLAYEEEQRYERPVTLYKQLSQLNTNDRLMICIGPEGGFTEKEVSSFKNHGLTSVRLGKRILRTETAALYALASLSYHLEEMED